MKAAVYYENGAPDVFSYEDVPDPACGPRDIVIDVKAISVEGGDVLNRAYGQMAGKPHIVGYMASGVIIEVGGDVRDREVGQRVSTLNMHGSHAEKRAVPAQTSWLLPDAVSFEEGACIPVTFGTAHDGLFEFGRLQAGETVLVQGGAGGVGLAAIQLAKLAGATVYATASSAEKLERLKAFGLDAGINYTEQDLVAEVQRLTEGRGVNLVLDPVGGNVLEQSIAATGARGRVVSVGTASRDFSRVDISGLAMVNRSLTGVFLGAEIATPRVQTMIGNLFEDLSKRDFEVLIDRAYPLEAAAAAHTFIESRQAVGRVVLTP